MKFFLIKNCRKILGLECKAIRRSLNIRILQKITVPVFYVRRLNLFKPLPLGTYISVPSPRTISAGDV